MEYKTDAEMEEIRKNWGGNTMERKFSDHANYHPKPDEYVKLDDVIALFVADMNQLDADCKEIVGDDTRAQIQRIMADSLKKHSSSLMAIALNKLKRYEF